VTNHSKVPTYLFGERQKVYLPDFSVRSNDVAITGPGRMVQYYESENFLHSTLREFVGTGLHAGHVCIVIATKAHIDELKGQLADAISQSKNTYKGRFIAMDVHQTLQKILVNGTPDWHNFMDTIGCVLEDAVKHGSLVRVFGETVRILSQDGKPEAARQMDQFWSDISAIYPFFLYSAYPTRRTDILPGHNVAAPDYRVPRTNNALQTETEHRKKTEAALEQLEVRTNGLLAEREHLIELNASKDEFISLASHQLRTPATGVKQYIGMLLQGFMGNLTEAQYIGLKKAYASNERQLKIVNDLLLVARVDAGKVTLNNELCDVVQLIQDVASEQEEEIHARGQQIVLRTPRSLQLHIDARYIRMVLENLVNNASKYSADGLPITVQAQRHAGTVRIRVKDQGVGIGKQDIPKLYQKFSRIYNNRSTVVDGTGLGLYWSKRIIELHSGTLGVSSRVGYGSTFTITLPGV
jgi:signal transduction histidine kinase